jgi:hypothetical protein
MKNILILLCLLAPVVYSHAQSAPGIEWQISLGGSKFENGEDIIQTADGAFVSCGVTESVDGDVSGQHGSGDGWAVKLNAAGQIMWQRCLGGTGSDELASVNELPGGDLVFIGSTSSGNGDVSGNHGLNDVWLVRLSSEGNLISQKCLGGSSIEKGAAISLTSDGGFVFTGIATSSDGDVGENKGFSDIWVVKLDSLLNIEWEKSFGGGASDVGTDVQQTADGGFIVLGYTFSLNGDASCNHGDSDGLLLRLDAAGHILWSRCFGGSATDALHAIRETAAGDFLLCGRTRSNDGDVSGHHNLADGKDYLFARLDASGNTLSQRCFGGLKDDCSYDLILTQQGGAALIGHSYSNDFDVNGNNNEGKPDYWLVVLDSADQILWQKCVGGIGGAGLTGDNPYGVVQSADGGFVITGRSDSPDGDVTGNHGKEDMWVVKLAGTSPSHSIATGAVSPLIYSPGATVIIPYSLNGDFAEENVFTAQLSDATGAFTTPVPIGSVASASAGEIIGVIPPSSAGGTAYRIRVVSSDPVVTGSDNGVNLTIEVVPPACEIPGGLFSSEVTVSSAILNWTAEPAALSYKIRYRKSGTSTWTNTTSTTSSKTIAGLAATTAYQWQVKSICQTTPSISSAWSLKSNFSTLLARFGAPDAFNAEIFPNPVAERAWLHFETFAEENWRIEVFNSMGQRLQVIYSGPLAADAHRMEINTTGWPPGYYRLRLAGATAERSLPLIVEK